MGLETCTLEYKNAIIAINNNKLGKQLFGGRGGAWCRRLLSNECASKWETKSYKHREVA